MKILILALLLAGTSAYSQSWERIEIIPADIVNFIYSDGDTVYSATDSLIYISRDKGRSWSILSANSPSRVQAMIKINGSLYAGTYGLGVYVSTDGGINWNAFNNGLSDWAHYVSRFYLMNNKLYLGSDGGGVFYLDIINPRNWIQYNQDLPSLVGWSVNCMTGSKDNLILSSGANGALFIRKPNSAGWTFYYIDSVKTPQAWSLLTFGEYVLAGTNKTIYRSADNGFNWDSVGISALPLKSSVLRSYGKTIYAGLIRNEDFFIWTSVDSGITWQSLDHQFHYLLDLYVSDSLLLAATGDGLWSFNRLPVSVPAVINNSFEDARFGVYPNPFNPVTNISFTIPEESYVQLSIYDIRGKLVKEIIRGGMKKGTYEHRFNAKHLPGGIYVFILQVNGKHYSNKSILLK